MAFSGLVDSYTHLWKGIIMPPRQEYSDYSLGSEIFTVGNTKMQRKEVSLTDKRNNKLACSFFYNPGATTTLPCVVYLHGNGCSRVEAVEYVQTIMSNGMNLFCFDFPACGMSEGEFSSLGFFEQDDLDVVVQYLKNEEKVKNIAIWGRSMGAVTTLLYASRNAWSLEVSCLVLDSPFAEFKRLFKEQAKKRTSMPGILSEGAFSVLKMTIQDKAGFDLSELKPIAHAPKIYIPVLFGASKDDDLIPPTHTQDLHAAYGGAKKLFMFEGSHNSQRPIDWVIEVVNLMKVNMLNAPTVNYEEAKRVFSSLRKRPTYKSPTHNVINEEGFKRKVNELNASPRKWQVDTTPPTQPIKITSPKNQSRVYYGIFSPKSSGIVQTEVDSLENSTTCNSEDVTPSARKKTIISPSKLSQEAAKSRKLFSDLKIADVGVEESGTNIPRATVNPSGTTSPLSGSPSRRLRIFDQPKDSGSGSTASSISASGVKELLKAEEVPTSSSKSIYKGLSFLTNTSTTPKNPIHHSHSQSYSIYSHSQTLPSERRDLNRPPQSPTLNKKIIFSPKSAQTVIHTLDTSFNREAKQLNTSYTLPPQDKRSQNTSITIEKSQNTSFTIEEKQKSQNTSFTQHNNDDYGLRRTKTLPSQQQPQSSYQPLYYPNQAQAQKISHKPATSSPGQGGSMVYRIDVNSLAALQSSMFQKPTPVQQVDNRKAANYSYTQNVPRKDVLQDYLPRQNTTGVNYEDRNRAAPIGGVQIAGMGTNVRYRNNLPTTTGPIKVTVDLKKTISSERPVSGTDLNLTAGKGA